MASFHVDAQLGLVLRWSWDHVGCCKPTTRQLLFSQLVRAGARLTPTHGQHLSVSGFDSELPVSIRILGLFWGVSFPGLQVPELEIPKPSNAKA